MPCNCGSENPTERGTQFPLAHIQRWLFVSNRYDAYCLPFGRDSGLPGPFAAWFNHCDLRKDTVTSTCHVWCHVIKTAQAIRKVLIAEVMRDLTVCVADSIIVDGVLAYAR